MKTPIILLALALVGCGGGVVGSENAAISVAPIAEAMPVQHTFLEPATNFADGPIADAAQIQADADSAWAHFMFAFPDAQPNSYYMKGPRPAEVAAAACITGSNLFDLVIKC